MKRLATLLTTAFLISSASAAELSASDGGTYEWLNPKKEPTGVLYRLSLVDGKWLAEGRFPGQEWMDISCGPQCSYRPSRAADVQSFFPPDWLEHARISCIQNIAQAFCRLESRDETASPNYMVVVLTQKSPIPVFVRKISTP